MLLIIKALLLCMLDCWKSSGPFSEIEPDYLLFFFFSQCGCIDKGLLSSYIRLENKKKS